MNVGHGVAPIPVADGALLGGYVDRPGPSHGVADGLEAHALSVCSEGRRVVLVVLDVVCVNEDLAAAVASAFPSWDVWVCATHTHSGPETGCHPRGATTPAPWLAVCTSAAVAAASAAVRAEEPAFVSAGVSLVSEVASVRSRQSGALPVPVDVVAFHTASGLGGLLVVLPVHPTVLPATSRVVSADLTGAVRRALADRAPWVVVATGAAGDISTRGVRRAADPAECTRLGHVVADQLDIPTATPTTGPIRTATTTLTVTPLSTGAAPPGENCRCTGPVPRQVTFSTFLGGPVARWLRWRKGRVRPGTRPSRRLASERLDPPINAPTSLDGAPELDLGAPDGFCRCEPIASNRSPVLSRQEETLRQARRLVERSDQPLSATVRVARLGDVELVGLPGEPFLGLRPPGVILVGYVGGYLGYLPTRDAFAGPPTYETVISPIAPGEAERMVDAARRLLSEG